MVNFDFPPSSDAYVHRVGRYIVNQGILMQHFVMSAVCLQNCTWQ